MGSLQEKRQQFLRVQERVQARNVGDAAAAAAAAARGSAVKQELSAAGGNSSSSRAGGISNTAGGAGRGALEGLQATDWLKDTEKYAAILEARQMPLGQKMKKIVDLLFKQRQGFTAQEIERITFVDLTTSKELQDAMQINPKVTIEGGKYVYKAKHELKSRDDLLRLIRQHIEGIPFSDVKDAYPEVAAHCQELKAAGQIWILYTGEGVDQVLFPNDPKIRIKVDNDVKMAIREIDLPLEFVDMEKELIKSGHKPASTEIRRLRTIEGAAIQQKPKQKRKRESSRTKYTNSHLPELFQNNPMP